MYLKKYTLYCCGMNDELFKIIIKGPSIKDKIFDNEYMTHFIIYNVLEDIVEFHVVISREPKDYINNVRSVDINLDMDSELKIVVIKELDYINKLLRD